MSISIDPFVKKVHALKQKGVPYNAIATDMGYSPPYFSRIIAGQANLDFNFINAACKYFNCGISEIIEYICDQQKP